MNLRKMVSEAEGGLVNVPTCEPCGDCEPHVTLQDIADINDPLAEIVRPALVQIIRDGAQKLTSPPTRHTPHRVMGSYCEVTGVHFRLAKWKQNGTTYLSLDTFICGLK